MQSGVNVEWSFPVASSGTDYSACLMLRVHMRSGDVSAVLMFSNSDGSGGISFGFHVRLLGVRREVFLRIRAVPALSVPGKASKMCSLCFVMFRIINTSMQKTLSASTERVPMYIENTAMILSP